MLLPLKTSINQPVDYKTEDGLIVHLTIKREDLLHKHISGNKYRKLRYNLEEAKKQGYSTIITFGGAFSNHIAATAAAAKEFGFKSIGIIRGDELSEREDVILQNPTLRFATINGMQFDFVSRSNYRQKNNPKFIKNLLVKYGSAYIVPEGGTNDLAVKGCKEILMENDQTFNKICCAIGTGGTISGVINSALPHQTVIGFPALKGEFLENVIKSFTFGRNNWVLNHNYNFGGFAKINDNLIRFINDFKKQTCVQLDPIYTGKMIYGIVDLYKKGYFKSTDNILAIHTGGLQGIDGINMRLKSKRKTLILSDTNHFKIKT